MKIDISRKYLDSSSSRAFADVEYQAAHI